MIMFNQVLMVCTGNVCRSVMAERLLKARFPSLEVASAGTGALVGKAADKQANAVSQENSLSLDGHSAQQLTSELCAKFPLILAMEKHHIDEILTISPESRGKVFLLGHWLNNQEITDPYKQSDELFSHVYKLIDRSVSAWQEKLQS
jgi:protein-tyrosine phosphatase